MISIQTNIYPILNLDQLSSYYRVYRILNLHSGQEEYYQNCQLLNRRISYELRTPAIVIQRDDGPYLIVKDDAAPPPSPYPLVRTAVHFECCSETVNLDYTHRSSENDIICLRFLHFLIQTPLHNNPQLWQANSGSPFYEKRPQEKHKDISIFRGFRIRPIILSNSSMGLCVDVASKYVCNVPLPHDLDLEAFKRKWEACHCIYHYGHQWYDVRLASLADQNASEYLIVQDKKLIKLIDYITQNSAKPIPPELAQMPHDCSVVLYKDNRGEERAAPTALCYPSLDTSEMEIRAAHHKSLLSPNERLRIIDSYLHRYITRLRFGDTCIKVASKPITTRSQRFTLPDYKFGGSTTISVRGTPNSQHVDLAHIGKVRLKSLFNKNIGFYCDDPLPK
ncbi:MAG: hypothetical protein ACFFEE_11735 [Candidatus Thorarchaeota archaeon]